MKHFIFIRKSVKTSYLTVIVLINICCFVFQAIPTNAQNVSINASAAPPNASAMLDVDVSALTPKKGLLIPRVTAAERAAMNPLPAAAQGLMVYQTNGVEGIYYNTSLITIPNWIYIAPSTNSWNITGNSGTNPATNFLGTTDPQPLIFKVSGQRSGYIDFNNAIGAANMSLGYQALFSNTVAGNNTAIGYQALFTQSFNNGGTAWDTYNVALGNGALYNNQPTSIFDGSYNTAIGYGAMYNNTNGYYSTAVGTKALYSNTIGARNTAVGMFALIQNTTGSENTALGYHALSSQSFNNGGVIWTSGNTALGSGAMNNNQPTSTTNGINNTALGYQSLYFNTTGTNNAAIGSDALINNTAAGDNIAIGYQALYTQSFNNGNVPYPGKNIAIGTGALFSNQPTNTFSGINNVAIGFNALNKNTTADFNVAVGTSAMTNNQTGFDNTAIGTNSLLANTLGNYNTSTGMGTLVNNTIGIENTASGMDALNANTTAGNNTAIGYNALVNQSYSNSGIAYNSDNVGIGANALINNQPTSSSNGINNTAVGYQALSVNVTGFNNTSLGYLSDVTVNNLSNATAIGYNAKVSASNSLVLGGTAADAVNVGIGCSSPAYRLHVIGDIAASGTVRTTFALVTGAISACSDARFKKDIEPLQNSLSNIMRLQGVSYFWKTKEFPDRYFTDKKQVGIVAQELEKVYPELVMTDKDGYKSVDYTRLTPILIESVKEQQLEIQQYKAMVNESNKKMEVLAERLANIEKLMTAKGKTGN